MSVALCDPRILLKTWTVDRSLALQLLFPVAFITLVAFVLAYLLYRKAGQAIVAAVHLTDPLNFWVAIRSGVIYMAVQWLMEITSAHHSPQSPYAASLVFGATDMVAITLSIARKPMMLETLQGVTAILLATLSNTLVKFLIAVIFGDESLRKWVGLGFGFIFVPTVVGMGLLWLMSVPVA